MLIPQFFWTWESLGFWFLLAFYCICIIKSCCILVHWHCSSSERACQDSKSCNYLATKGPYQAGHWPGRLLQNISLLQPSSAISLSNTFFFFYISLSSVLLACQVVCTLISRPIYPLIFPTCTITECRFCKKNKSKERDREKYSWTFFFFF